MKKFIGYYRVSTDRQGRSGLGLEAQFASVREYVSTQGELVAEYTEVESGKRADRPKLRQALSHARRIGAILVIAKLDRLARNVAFLSALMESGTEFIAVDNLNASKLTIHLLAAVAEDEARRISQRTKDALKAFKARGGKLGSQHPKGKKISTAAAKIGQPLGAAATSKKATEAYADLLPELIRLRDCGFSYKAIARILNGENQTTRLGKPWNPVQVKRVLRRSS